MNKASVRIISTDIFTFPDNHTHYYYQRERKKTGKRHGSEHLNK